MSWALHRLHRHLRLVPEIFFRNTDPVGQQVLKNNVLFGSDYPLLTPDRWMADFETPWTGNATVLVRWLHEKRFEIVM